MERKYVLKKCGVGLRKQRALADQNLPADWALDGMPVGSAFAKAVFTTKKPSSPVVTCAPRHMLSAVASL